MLLLPCRAVQEGKNQLSNDYTLQPQHGVGGGGAGGAGAGMSFFDQSNMSYNHGVGGTMNSNSSRKRGREMPVTTEGGGGGGGASIMNRPLMSMAPQQTQLLDLTQLQNNTTTPQRNAVSIGLGLTFGENLHQQQQQQSLHHQPQHSFSLSPQSSAQSSVLLSILSDDLASHIKQQRDEVEHFLLAQGEQLRRTLAEKRQRHYRSLLSAAEESVARRLREKEAEVEKASRRNAELEAKAAQLSIESQAWQHRAKMQEHMAANLQAQLERAIISTGGAGAAGTGYNNNNNNNNNVASQVQERDEWGGNDSGAVGGGEAEDAESAYIDPDRVVEKPGPPCKACRRRVASVVLLPCRHLSLCTECDAVAQACPLCLGLRSSSLEIFLS
ncbi:OLC1v1031522C3 [Oldenlandia corymbosa var. corymbosa]|uniref:OLC1v1031522C3 n=1 Tax=Oldenlandia corymbosa var. corymbosa TaxID=529605 RepID=A0AAV1CII7_OLDCO|nr:OLC1v1031522C3 [Oldenlandia corymbosa var. corymbosa]